MGFIAGGSRKGQAGEDRRVGVELSGEEEEDWNEEVKVWDWESIVYTRLVASI